MYDFGDSQQGAPWRCVSRLFFSLSGGNARWRWLGHGDDCVVQKIDIVDADERGRSLSTPVRQILQLRFALCHSFRFLDLGVLHGHRELLFDPEIGTFGEAAHGDDADRLGGELRGGEVDPADDLTFGTRTIWPAVPVRDRGFHERRKSVQLLAFSHTGVEPAHSGPEGTTIIVLVQGCVGEHAHIGVH